MDAFRRRPSLVRAVTAGVRSLVERPFRALRNRRTATMSAGVGKGLRFSCGPSNERYGVGDNEMPVQHVLERYLARGAVFLDVGANVGFLTVIGARLVGEQGRVFAFEPLRPNADLVRRNVAQNGFRNVVVIEQAASDSTGTARLIVAAYSGGSALDVAERPEDAVAEQTVPTITIDEALARGLIAAPTFVKIDVEGAEYQVLRGMTATLRKFRPTVLFEIDGPDVASVAAKASPCRRLLEEQGYEIRQLDNSYPGNRWLVDHYLALPAR